MEAVVVTAHGGPEVLELQQLPLPVPAPDAVLIAQHCCGVNFIDTHFRAANTTFAKREPPFICGGEGAGVVQAVGAAVEDLRVGMRVVYSGSSGDSFAGSYSTHVAVPAASVIPLPDAVTFEDGCSAFVQGTTAHYLLCDSYAAQPGDWLLIHAAAGGTGSALVQVAKLRGARVIATCSTPEKAEIVKGLGADEVCLCSEDWVERTRELTGGVGVAAVLDGVGRDTFLRGFECLRKRGAMIMFGEASGAPDPFDVTQLTIFGSVTLSYPTGGDYNTEPGQLRGRAEEVFRWMSEGKLRMAWTALPLAEAAEAHRRLEGRQTTGKVLLLCGDGGSPQL